MFKTIGFALFSFALYATSVFLFNHMTDAVSPNDICGYGLSFVVLYLTHCAVVSTIFTRKQ